MRWARSAASSKRLRGAKPEGIAPVQVSVLTLTIEVARQGIVFRRSAAKHGEYIAPGNARRSQLG